MAMQTAFAAPFPLTTATRIRPLLHPRRPKMVLQTPNTPAVNTPSQDPLQSTLSRLRACPVVLCIRQNSPETALRCAEAAIRGGLTTIEMTLTTPHALQLIRTLNQNHPSALIGAGTVLTVPQATAAAEAGAAFALSPVTDPGIISHCHSLNLLAVPGAATPTEIHSAYVAGARVVKIFPVNLYGGLDFVRAMQGPLAHIPLLPTSGIDAALLPHYLASPNVLAVGASSQILTKSAVAGRDWDEVSRRAAVWAAIAAEHRSPEAR